MNYMAFEQSNELHTTTLPNVTLQLHFTAFLIARSDFNFRDVLNELKRLSASAF